VPERSPCPFYDLHYLGRQSTHCGGVSHFEDRKQGECGLGEHSVPFLYSSPQAQFMRYRLSNG
jgi:hypothetical protein